MRFRSTNIRLVQRRSHEFTVDFEDIAMISCTVVFKNCVTFLVSHIPNWNTTFDLDFVS